MPIAENPLAMRGMGSRSDAGASMAAFRKLKPICVSLMALNSSPPTSHSQHAPLLSSLHSTLTTLPAGSLNASTINYALYPLTSIIRQSNPIDLPDSFLEATFRVLSYLGQQWKDLEGGMDIIAWEQLWRFTTSCVGPGLGKGKGKERSQDVQLEAVNFLGVLLGPSTSHPTTEMKSKFGNAKAPLMPTLFQTITLLLSTSSPDPPYLDLQLSSLRLLRQCIRYLKGQHRVLAAILPGTMSAMSKLVHAGGKGLKGDVAADIAGVVEDIVVQTLNDEDLRTLGLLRTKLDDLSQLDTNLEEEEPETPRPDSSKDPFPPLSSSYLSFTSAQLLTAIPSILPLSTHPTHTARIAAANLAYNLISTCRESLSLARPCLTTLLHLSNDDFDPVRTDASEKLQSLLSVPGLDTDLIEILTSSLNSLPRLITSQQDQKAESTAKLVTALAGIDVRGVISELLGPEGKVERWGWSLLSCLEFGRPSGSFVKRRQEIGDGGLPGFPHLPLRHVEAESTVRALTTMLISLGHAGGSTALHSIEHFLSFAKTHRGAHIAKAVSAIWVADKLLGGVATAEENGIDGKVGKATRKMAREAARLATVLDEEVEEEEETAIPSDELVPIERTKGLDNVVTMLDKKPLADSYAADTTRKLHIEGQKMLLRCLSLSLLSTSSRILGSSFRSLLLTSLYTLLAHLGSRNIISEYAEIALSHVAYNAGYASVQNLVLDNVDYVVNVVAQRLTYRRLDSQAPLVLIAMIRLVGDEIVPMVHDVVDEIFDALDDYHGYESLATSLLAVLMTLVDVMKAEVDATGVTQDRLDRKLEMSRLGEPPDPVKDFAKFGRWYGERNSRNQEEMDNVIYRASEQFKKEESEEQPQPEEEEDRPTRSQEVAKAILSKSIYFLTHPSPFLRARVLGLIARVTPVLASANRESDLLPSIDQAWGGILNRLEDQEPYVVTESAEAIASLCENVGDFMSRRVLDYAWPRMKILLDKQRVLDEKSALARRGFGTETSYSVSHRLHVAVLRTAIFIAQEVPVDDDVLWDMMVMLRWFLDKRAHQDLQAKAMSLYEALGRRDGDALWICLRETLDGEGVWSHLADSKLDIEHNAHNLLAVI